MIEVNEKNIIKKLIIVLPNKLLQFTPKIK